MKPDQAIRIERPDDPRVEAYVSLRERDLTNGHGGRFIVEGKVTLETLLRRSRFEVESLFLCEAGLRWRASSCARRGWRRWRTFWPKCRRACRFMWRRRA